MLESEELCREYLKIQSVPTIARQIRRDQEACQGHRLPSLLVHYLPAVGSELADEIAIELCPETAMYGRSITRAQYSGIVGGIKSYLDQMSHSSRLEKLPITQVEEYRPSSADIQTTLGVLDFCLKNDNVLGLNLKTPLEDVFQILNAQLQRTKSSKSLDQPEIPSGVPRKGIMKKCYICQFTLVLPHSHYHSLCKQCGDFNLASGSLSLPESLQLHGKTALVTGGRLNLGYHTALRLLRCGAKVIISTRYPRDAETRYMAEHDFQSWQNVIKIVGADFRAAADVFQLVTVVQEQLVEWSDGGVASLDILINNAAQTWTDPLKVERQAVEYESHLLKENGSKPSALLKAPLEYQPRVRGGVQSLQLRAFESSQPVDNSMSSILGSNTSDKLKDSVTTYEKHVKTSWLQSIYEIPYEDVISAHSVNTFVPLILLKELLPLMGALRPPGQPRPHKSKPSKPLGHIINVSSREGVFESKPGASTKRGHHVHTNLTKAALNMLTETEAGPAWKLRRVAINSVDPGYLSAPPEIEERWKEEGGDGCPIGWEDGAGRVLWPIAVGERGDGLIWGRFLKHYGSTVIDVGVGR